jgi:hypothetical protein
MRSAYRILVGSLKGGKRLEDLGVDGRLILVRKWDGKLGTGFMWLRRGSSGRILGTQ